VDLVPGSILTQFALSRFCSPYDPVLLSAYDRLSNHLFLLCHAVPHHHNQAFIVAPEDRSRRCLAVSGWWRPLTFPVNFLPWFPLLSSADSKKGGSSMMVQPRTFLAPYTCRKERSTCHLEERWPAFSSRSCRTRSLWNNLTSSSGSPWKVALLWVHAPFGIVQLYCACSDVATP
jgi:hypothetical protein